MIDRAKARGNTRTRRSTFDEEYALLRQEAAPDTQYDHRSVGLAEDARQFADAFLSWYNRDGAAFDSYMSSNGYENTELQAMGSRDMGDRAIAGLYRNDQDSELYSNGMMPFEDKVQLMQSRYRINDHGEERSPSSRAVRDYLVMHEWRHKWQKINPKDSEQSVELENERGIIDAANYLKSQTRDPEAHEHYDEVIAIAQEREYEIIHGTSDYSKDALEDVVGPHNAYETSKMDRSSHPGNSPSWASFSQSDYN